MKLSWSLAFYRRANPIAWPLEDDNPSKKHLYLDRFIIWFAFIVLMFHTETNIHYLIIHLDDIESLSQCLPTNLCQIEINIRIINFAMRKNQLKKLQQYFYAEIYITPESDEDTFKRINRQLKLAQAIAVFYTATLLNFFEDLTKNNLQGRREMLFAQVYPFDNTWLPFYIPLICISFWVGLLVDTTLFGELNILGEFMMHLNARYLQLGKDLRLAAVRLLMSDDATDIAVRYKEELIKVLRRNYTLNSFAKEIENQYSFRIFISFGFSAAIICVLLFKCYSVCSGKTVKQ